MKKLFCLLLLITLTACQPNHPEYAIDFFDALTNTLSVDSATLDASIVTNQDERIDMKLAFNQSKQIELNAHLNLATNQKEIKDFLIFSIKDGNTYLDSLGTKTRSTANILNIGKRANLQDLNPFLDIPDDQLKTFFSKSEKQGDQYHFEIDPHQLATLLDNMNSVKISEATLDATIKNEKVTKIHLKAKGEQTIEKESAAVQFDIKIKISKLNQTVVHFPDLSTY